VKIDAVSSSVTGKVGRIRIRIRNLSA